MSRKDFELIARVLRSAELSRADRATLAASFAAALSSTNPAFNRERFMRASIWEEVTE
jgi:hypothetical protein